MTKTLLFNTAVVTGCVMTLMATGGTPAPTGTNPPAARVAPSYETLASTANKTSALGGVAIQTNNATSKIAVVSSAGTIKHDTGATTIDDGTYSLTDADGLDAKRVLTDGMSNLMLNSSGTYDYVATYTQSYTQGGTKYDVAGLTGIITRVEDMPKEGQATYTGDASGVVATTTQGFDLENGKSTVTADFMTNKVNVTLNGFTARDQTTGNVAAAPIDTVSVSGMDIADNGFSGGTLSTTLAGAAVDMTGPNTVQQSAGKFFGFDANQFTPDEVGGIAGARGDNGIVGTIFIAD